MKPGALIIAAHYASVLNRSCHERSSQDVLPSVIRGLSNDAARKTGVGGRDPVPFRHGHGGQCASEAAPDRAWHTDDDFGCSAQLDLAMTAEAFAHTPLSRDNKTGPENSGGASISGPHAPGEGASEFVSRGDATCVQTTRNDPASKSKSSARSFRAMHDCAVQPLPAPAEGFGLTKPPRNWPPEWDAPFEQQLTKSPETENHLRDLLALLWPKSPNGLCGND
jgi:hypothetical protein